MKRFLKLTLVPFLVLICLVFPMGADAATVDSGSCGTNLTWTLDETGVLTISGTGIMEDYSSTGMPWYSYRSSIWKVVVENGVTSIGDCAFYNFYSLGNLSISDSVTSIGDYAFYYCGLPGSVTISKNVTSIGYCAFSCGTRLESISVDSSNPTYTSDESGVLYNKAMTTLIQAPSKLNGDYSIPTSVTSISDYAFYHCDALTRITIPANVTSIGKSAFYFCESLTNMTIPESVNIICDRAFTGCKALTSVTISEGVNNIGDEAFSSCSALTSVTIPKSVTSIGNTPFKNCTMLKQIIVDSDNLNYASDDSGVLYSKDMTTLIEAPRTLTGSYNIPISVNSIGNSAFYDCVALTSVTIPEGVITIGDSAFCDCVALTSVTIPEGVITIGDSAFLFCSSLTNITIPKSVTCIGDFVFEACSALQSITIPEGIPSIGKHAFLGCSSLASAIIPDSVTSIGEYAFQGCDALTNVIIPKNVTSIGDAAFSYCSVLKETRFCGNAPNFGESCFSSTTATAYYPANNLTWTDTVMQNYGGTITWVPYTAEHTHEYDDFHKCDCGAIGGTCGDNLVWNFSEEIGTLTISGEGSMENYSTASKQPWYDYQTRLTELVIENGVTSVGNCAFDGCTNLATIDWGKITSIGDYAFYNCDGLTGSLVIPDSITRIGLKAFYDCDGVVGELLIPNGVTSMDGGAFVSCDGIDSLTIGSGLKSISDSAFADCSSLKTIDLGGVTSIEENAFTNCSRLTKVTFPKSIASIGAYSFVNCFDLSTIYFSGDAPAIGSYAFQSVTATAYYPADNAIWTDGNCQNYGGTITWEAYCTGHSYSAPNFVWRGYEACNAVFTCGNCGEIQNLNCKISVQITPATSSQEGKIIYTATVIYNGKTYTDTQMETIPKQEHVHSFGEKLCSDDTSHWKECLICGEKAEMASHTAGAEATENTSQKCTVCGYILRTPLGLDWFFEKVKESDNYLWASGYYVKIMEQYG